MSIKIMTHVWEHSHHKGSALLMLLAIADHANDDGQCWPSLPRLAARCRVGKRQAIKLIQFLEGAGAISVRHGRGRGRASVYTIKGVPQCTFYHGSPLQSDVSTGNGEPECTFSAKKVHSRAEKVHSSVVKGELQNTPTIIDPSENQKDPPLPPPRGEGVSVHASPGKKEKHRKTPLPDDPTEQDRLYATICDQALRLWCAAKAVALNLDEQWEAFVRDARAHARRYADWRAAFQNWLTSPYRVAAVARSPSDPAADRAARNREESRLFLERVKHGTA